MFCTAAAAPLPRQDLRLHDNPTIINAARAADEARAHVVFCFVDSPSEEGDGMDGGVSWRPGACSRLWTREALRALDTLLVSKYGEGRVLLRARGAEESSMLSSTLTRVVMMAIMHN